MCVGGTPSRLVERGSSGATTRRDESEGAAEGGVQCTELAQCRKLIVDRFK